MLSEAQREWLDANRLARDRWVYSSNAKPFIDEMCKTGILEPAHGEFRMDEPASDESVSILGKELPIIGSMVSLYKLTPAGRAARQESTDATTS